MKFLKSNKVKFDLALILFLSVFLSVTCQYSEAERLIPLIISIPTLFFQLIITVIHIRSIDKIDYADEGKEKDEADSNVFRIIAWIVGFSVLVFIFGFYPSLAAFSFLFLLLEGKVSLLKGAASAGIILCCIYIMFGLALQIKLWPGVVPEIVPGFLGGGVLPPL